MRAKEALSFLLVITFLIIIGNCHPVPDAVNSNVNDMPEESTFKELYGNGGEAKEGKCAPESMSAPVDVSPQVLDFPCISIPVTELATLINKTTKQLAKTDFTLLLNQACMKVETPAGLDFIMGASIVKDETGADYTKDFRLPLPSEIKGLDGIEDKLGTDLPDSIKLPSYTLPEDKALLVAKLTVYNNELFLKLVNIAGILTEDGRQFLGTLGDEAREHMSGAMKIDGPGVYGIYFASKEISFISGQVLKAGSGVPGAIITGTGSPFLSRADSKGFYSIANFQGQSGLAAYDLNSFARGEVFFNIEAAGEINPKTGEAPDTPAVAKEIPSLKGTLNMDSVNITIGSLRRGEVKASNLDFELGDLSDWKSDGQVSIESDFMSELFSGSSEKSYAFLTTGKGSIGEQTSTLV